jgi:hypothetical protein
VTTRLPRRIRRQATWVRPRKAVFQLELLEDRTLLAAGYAHTGYIVLHPNGQPFGTPGPVGYTPAQIRHAYGFDQITLPGNVAGDGAGTTIAIVDAYDNPNIANDLHQFDLAFNLPDPPSFTKVNQRGGTQLPPPDPFGQWEGEIALDVEWAHAIAPKANILLVEADDSSFTNLFTAVAFAAAQPGVVVVSMSFGGGEFASETSYDNTFRTPNGHTPVTFVASSGDFGAPPSYPSISPNVLSVGGTTVNLNSQGTILSESGWSGSGGGISAFEAQPAFQKGVVTQSSSRRTNPDVAYNADFNTGYPVYDSFSNGTSGPWVQVGGTSAAAPQWAALIAIADQGRALIGQPALDGVNDTLPMIYKLPAADFHDITTGSSFDGVPVYFAGPGYDLVTGIGTPIANKVVADLVATVAGPVVLSQTGAAPALAPVNTLQVTFDRPVQVSSFTAASIGSFTGPAGAITNATFTVTAVSPANGLATTFTIGFTDQTQSGAYSFHVGPNILDAKGNKMDQNRDGIPGEAGDYFTAAFAVANPSAVASLPTGILVPAVASVRVTFDSPMAVSSFDKGKVTGLKRKVGTVLTDASADVGSVVPVNPNNGIATQFDVTFNSPGEALTGVYFLTIGPGVRDKYGNPTLTSYTASFSVDGPKVVGIDPSSGRSSPVSSETVTFSRAMLVSSFTTGQVALSGPNGNIAVTVTPLNPVNGAATQFTLSFAAQSVEGNYTTVIGPNVTDVYGNKMDQNGNLTTGEATADQFVGRFGIHPALGPDAFGYAAALVAPPNLEIDGQASTFTIIDSGSGNDDVSLPLSLNGNTFNLYGATYTSLFVSSNGLISFTGPNDSYLSVDLKSSSSTEGLVAVGGNGPTDNGPLIAPLWDDWIKTSGSAMVEGQFRDFVNGKPTHLVIEWNQVQHYLSSRPITFQVELTLNTKGSSGNVLFNYQDIDTQDDSAFGGFATVGIKANGDQEMAKNVLQVSFHQTSPYVYSGNALQITAPSFGATITGNVYNDLNHNGTRSSGEPGLAGWTVFEDLNNNGVFDPGEPSGVTDASGNYTITDVLPGPVSLREVVQSGYARSLPNVPGVYSFTAGMRKTYPGMDFGNYAVTPLVTVDNADTGFVTSGPGWTTVNGGYKGSFASHLSTQVTNLATDGYGYRAQTAFFQNLEIANDTAAFTVIDSADDLSVPLDLGTHTFTMYGTTYTGKNQLFVSSNGLITFGAADANPFNTDLSVQPVQRAIAPLWNDWIAGPGTPMVVGEFDNVNHRLILEWNKVDHYPGVIGNGITFQVILSLDGVADSDIVFNYVNLTGTGSDLYEEGAGATVGIKDGGPQGANRIVISSGGTSPYVGSGKAIRFTTNPPPVEHDSATFTVTTAGAGAYELFATWTADPKNATNVQYQVFDGTTLLGTVTVNQQFAPDSALMGGTYWQKLGKFTTTSGSFKIVLNTDVVDVNHSISADAVFAAAAPVVPALRTAGAPGDTSSGGGGGSPLLRGSATDIAALLNGGQSASGNTLAPAPGSSTEFSAAGADLTPLDQLFAGGLPAGTSSASTGALRRALPVPDLIGDPLSGPLVDEMASLWLGVE